MALSPIKQRYSDLIAFYEWLVATYLPGKNIYLIGQNAPRPPNPYIAFNPISQIEYVGNDERRMDPNTGAETLRGQRIIYSDLIGYSDSVSRFDGSDNAWEMLQELRFSLGYPAVEEALCDITCRVLEEGTVLDVSENLNTTNEPRARLQIMLSTVIIQSIDNGEIEIINANGTVTGPYGEIISDISVSKP